jgi:MFS family permease
MKKKILGVEKDIIWLGIVSFLTDVSSEMIFSVFSVFFTVILGASAALLGIIEGLADFSSSSLDYVAGYISDKTGKRKPFAALGYSFSALAKILLIFANSTVPAAMFRVIERLGKSFRGPPRDAWIASIASKDSMGYSFGVHKALDKAGAVLGPLIAYAVLSMFGQNNDSFKLIFIIALVPAMLAVLLILFLKDKASAPKKDENIFAAYKGLSAGFRHYLKSAGLFSLAYFSFGFLLLKAYTAGFSLKDVVLLYALFNLAFVFVSAPIGKLGDAIGRKKIIILGYATYLIMSLGFVFAATKAHVIALFVLFGIFYSIDEGQSKAYISDVEKQKRGIAIGMYNFITGIIYLPASIIAGFLWKANPSYAFIFAAVISVAAMIYFIAGNRSNKPIKTD